MSKKLEVVRFLDNKSSTISKLIIRDKNGENCLDGIYGVELQWNNNEVGESCIPGGEYPLIKRTWGRYYKAYSERWPHEFVPEISKVSGRSAILIHAAANTNQLKGCIAPCYEFRVMRNGNVRTCGTSRDAYCELYEAIVGHKINKIEVCDFGDF